MALDPVIGTLTVAAFALLFASAALHKWRNLRHFDQVFAAYALLRASARLRVSWLVPLFETAVAAGLLFDATLRPAAIAGMLLLLAYGGAMALNLRRGRRDIACGCGGSDEQRPIAAWMAWRNLVLTGLLALAVWPASARALTITDGITIGCGLGAATLIYLCVDRLGQLADRSRQLSGLA
jgi:methylamine utilization protein MauE